MRKAVCDPGRSRAAVRFARRISLTTGADGADVGVSLDLKGSPALGESVPWVEKNDRYFPNRFPVAIAPKTETVKIGKQAGKQPAGWSFWSAGFYRDVYHIGV